MDKQTLKDIIMNIQENKFMVPKDMKTWDLAFIMMDYIGDIDSELRDDLILTTLFHWIEEGVLSQQECADLLKIAVDEKHLLSGLENTDDTVFCRTFSVEVIASIMKRHNKEKFLEEKDFYEAFLQVLKFYNKDKDVRGFIEGKGWAHGAAHGADALCEFAKCIELDKEDLKVILELIYKKVNVNNYTYIHFEDERMVTTVLAVLERNILSQEEILDWIGQFKLLNKSLIYLENMAVEINVSTFLKTLYFRLPDNTDNRTIKRLVMEVQKQISRFK